ncbi:MAG: Calx-beta domain-containing protein, partial [Verrucomicrobiota bacterium]
MKTFRQFIPLSVILAAGLLSAPLPAAEQALFSDNFDTDTSANWNLVEGSRDGTPDYTADFAFDYGAVKYVSNGITNLIPAAPNSAGGITKGVKLTVNNNDANAAAAAVSLYPKDRTFSGNYALRVDMWLNYNGPAFGGSGSTEHGTFGLNHAGDKVNWGGSTSVPSTFASDGVWFAVAGEAGDNPDYRAFVGDTATPAIPLRDVAGGFLDRDGDGLPEENVVDPQPGTFPFRLIFPSPPHETPGAPGKQWVQVEVRQRTNDTGTPVVTWLMNGYVIAEHSQAAEPTINQLSGNVMMGYMDIFNSIASPREDNFVLFDNLRVVSLDTEPIRPLVSIVATDATGAEPGTDTAAFTIARTGSTGQPLAVQYRISGAASNGVDYAVLPGSITIPAGASSAEIKITPINDARAEPTENVVLILAGSTGYEVRESLSAAVEIADDGDANPTVTLSVVRPVAYEFIPARAGQFSVNLSAPSTADFTVGYTISGTAVNGADFVALPGSVTIPAGATSAVLKVLPIDNNKLDTNRTVIITLAGGPGYTPGSPLTGTVTIRNDDLPAGTLLFSDNFDADTTSLWTVNVAHADNFATFSYDYSADGIPSAPNSTNGTTRGLKLESNVSSGTFTGLSVSPTGRDFTGDYRLRFDLWINYNGPLNGGGFGSTQAATAGVGTKGETPQWPGGTPDSAFFAVTGDGGSSTDYRAYISGGASLAPNTGAYAAGTGTAPDSRNNLHPYYGEFGREAAPEAQLALHPNQTGTTTVGAAGVAWRDVVITRTGASLTWSIDGLPIASIDTTSLNLSTNIFLGYFDTSASLSDNVAMSFGLIDNVRVESLTGPVEPPVITITRVELLPDNRVRILFSATGTATQFAVESAASLTGAFGQEATADIQLLRAGPPSGDFAAVVAASGPMRFYRV